jgi:hypothetical protein
MAQIIARTLKNLLRAYLRGELPLDLKDGSEEGRKALFPMFGPTFHTSPSVPVAAKHASSQTSEHHFLRTVAHFLNLVSCAHSSSDDFWNRIVAAAVKSRFG